MPFVGLQRKFKGAAQLVFRLREESNFSRVVYTSPPVLINCGARDVHTRLFGRCEFRENRRREAIFFK